MYTIDLGKWLAAHWVKKQMREVYRLCSNLARVKDKGSDEGATTLWIMLLNTIIHVEPYQHLTDLRNRRKCLVTL